MAGGLAYVAFIFSILFAKETRAGLLFIDRSASLLAIFAFLSLSVALACFKEKRWGYIYATGLSILVLLLYNIDNEIVTYLYNPTNYEFFVASLSALSVLPLIVFFSIQSFRNSKTATQRKYLATPFSAGGLLTVTVIGFLIGGSLVGLISGSTVSNLVSKVVKGEQAGTIR